MKASPVAASPIPIRTSGSSASPAPIRVADAGEVGRARAAVDERQPVEQRRRAQRADDQVLEAGLERLARAAAPSRRARRAAPRAARSRRRTRPGSAPGPAGPCPAPRRAGAPGTRRGAAPLRGARRPARASDSGTTKAAAKIAIRAAASPSSSSRSAPATRSLRSPHCQMHRPAAAASVVRRRPRRRARWRRSLRTPADQHDADPGGQRDHGREPGVVDVGGGEGHRRLARSRPAGAYAGSQPADPRGTVAAALGGRRLRSAGGARRRDLVLDRRVAAAEDQARVERQGDDAGDERRQHQPRRGGRSRATRPRRELAVVHRALEQADRVEGREHDADRGHEGVDDLRLEDADQDVELADEVGGPRHRQGRQRDDQEQRREHGRPHRQPAEPGQVLACRRAPQSRATIRKIGADDQAVVDHLEHRRRRRRRAAGRRSRS